MKHKLPRKKRWIALNFVFWMSIILIALFGLFDSIQIKGLENVTTYEKYVMPAFIGLWFVMLLFIGLIYIIITKDISEGIGLFLAPAIMLWFGLEDVFFFIFSKAEMTVCMSWFREPQNIVSRYILNETCVSPLGLFLNALFGIVLGLAVFYGLREVRK